MARKTYVCDTWPSLTIGWVQFRDGKLTTDDESVQALIEGRESFGVQVQLAESDEMPIAPIAEPIPEDEPAPRRGPGRPSNAARQGQTSTGDLRP